MHKAAIAFQMAREGPDREQYTVVRTWRRSTARLGRGGFRRLENITETRQFETALHLAYASLRNTNNE